MLSLSFISRLFRTLPKPKKVARQRANGVRLSLEPLESRLTPTNVTVLNFNIPTDVANQGVHVGLYSNSSGLYLDPTSHTFQALPASGTQLPLITLANGTYTQPVKYQLAIPAGQDVISGELFIFIGPVHSGLPVVGTGTPQVAAPKAAPDPATPSTPDNFAQFEFNYKETAGPGQGLDIDISAVDSTGFPFSLVYPSSANLPFPLNPLGITLDQTDLNVNFKSAFSNGGIYSQFPEFTQGATFAQIQDPGSLQVVAPQDILAVESSPPVLNTAIPTADASSNLVGGANYYYLVTAYSNNVIDGSGGVVGETLASNIVPVTNLAAGNSVQVSWSAYFDPNTAGYNVYRYSATDGTAPTNDSLFNLIAHLPGAGPTTSTTFTATFANGATSITVVGTPSPALAVGQSLSGPGIAPGATISGVSGSTVTISTATTAAATSAVSLTAEAVTYTDTGAVPQAQQISVNSASNYGFNPLSEYYTSEIQAFFDHYTAPNSFVLNRNGSLWIGNTVEYTPEASWNTAGATYTVLQLTAQNDVAGTSIKRGQVVNIYEPIFASNTRFVTANAPPMPGWMSGTGGTSPYESPSQMVFGCDAVFASNAFDPDVAANGDLATALGAIENSIVTAFNRGIATNYNIPPDNWAAFPQMLNFPTVATDANSQVTTPVTYYYEVTAVNVYGETTPSLEVSATLNAGQSATLNWLNGANAAPATAYKIYRGTTPDNLTLLFTTPNGQQTSYTDEGGTASATALTNQYFSPGTTSNWYAAYVQTNSLLDPAAGVSINGLSYGFPFSDQGGVSTNILFPPGSIPANITVNLGELSGPGFVTQFLPDAVVSTAYQQTIVASGNGAGTTYSVSSGSLPNWLALDTDTGVLSGTAPSTPTATPYQFTITASNSAGTTALPFSFSVNSAAPAPLSIPGLAGGNLTLPAADVNLPYSTQFQVLGGTGPYTLGLVPVSAQLPPGLSFGTLGVNPTPTLTSPNGLFTLSGTQTQAYNNPNVGFNVVVTDSANIQLNFTIKIAVNPALSITTTTLPDAVVNTPYSQAILTNNTLTGAVSFAVTSGTLPAGLSLTQWGVLSGTPTASGPSSFTVTATDSAGGTDPQTYNFNVGSTPTPTLTFTTTSLPPTAPTATYNQTISTSGGSGAITFAIVNGTLPSGLSLNSGTGAITGTPTAPGGNAIFTVRATDVLGNVAYQGYQLGVLTITPSTQTLAANAPTLVIRGAGFDPSGTNTVALSSGTGTVTVNSPTQLTVTLTSQPTTGVLNATVTVNGVASTQQQVANLVASSTPTITASTNNLAANATTLVITGNGFDTSLGATNVVALSSGTVQSVTVNSAMQLTVSVAGPFTAGSLTATVTTDGVPSSSVQVATVVSGFTPTLNFNPSNLFDNVATLVITGTGFDASGSNVVSLTKPDNTPVTFTSVTVNSSNQLTLTGVALSGITGAINAIVTVDGVSSRQVQVANVLTAGMPVIALPATAPNLSPEATTLAIHGWGFTASSSVTLTAQYLGATFAGNVDTTTLTGFTTTVDSPNQITLSNLSVINNVPFVTMNFVGYGYTSAPTVTFSGGGATLQATGVANYANGIVTGVTLTHPGSGYTSVPTVTFTGGGAVAFTGDTTLNSNTITNIPDTSSLQQNMQFSGPGIPPGAVITNVAANSITFAAANGATATATASGVTLSTGATGTVSLKYVANILGQVSDPTNGSSAGTPQLAKVLAIAPAAPTITASTVTNPFPALVITGTGFDPSGTNVVTLYSDAAGLNPLVLGAIAPLASGTGPNVIANSATQLTVTLAGPLPLGQLYARVTTDGVPMAGSPVQVANVVGPAITLSTTNVSASPITLNINGVAFDPTNNASNIVTLYGPGMVQLPSSTVVSVVANSSTQLTVVLNGASPLPAGVLSATVTIDGVSSGAPVQVANVVTGPTSPTITFSADRLAANAPTLVIHGTGFDTVGSNTVTLSTSAGPVASAVAGVVANSATQLTVTLNPNTVPIGQLLATVATATATSPKVHVATVVAASTPTINVNTMSLNASATTLVITGAGFDTNAGGTNVVSLSSGTVQSVTVNSATQLTVTFTGPLTAGALRATVTTDGVLSVLQQVATVISGSTPSITASTNQLTTTATTLVINGANFDTNNGATHQVTLSSGTVQSVAVNSATQLTVTLNPNVSPLATGLLTATVTVNGVPSNTAQVANVVNVPVITPSGAPLVAGASTLTITGTGFDPTDANNSVALSSGAGVVISASSTSLTVQLTQTPTAGVLTAHVVVNGVVSQAATVAFVLPGVTASTANLAATASTLTITGAGFDPVAAHNLVALSTGSGVVTAATATQLTVTFSSPPQVGPLVAIVIVNGAPGSAQVANVVPGPAAVATSTISVSAANFLAGGSINVTLQARDALGNNLTTGGLNVAFALATGSAGGTLGPVTDNQDGTYTATFASSKMGATTFTATINGAKVTATATTNVFFQSSFPGTGTLGAPWLKKAGSFTVASNIATAGAGATNIAVYNGTARANLSASVTVSNITTGKLAALVTRYTSNTAYYRAGIQNIGGSFFAVIQRVTRSATGGVVVTTLSKKPITFSGSGTITFEAVGPSLRLYLDGSLVAAVTNTTHTSGSVGIWGSSATTFANFSASAINLQNATFPFSDNFAPTSNGQLSTFWTDQLGNFTVQSAQALAGSAAVNLAIVNGATTAKALVSATVGALNPGQSAAVVGRYRNNANMYYAGVFNRGGTVFAEIYRVVNGVTKKLKSVALTSFSGGTITFSLTGTSLQLIVSDTVNTVVSATDASITAAGRVGIRGAALTQFSSFSATVP